MGIRAAIAGWAGAIVRIIGVGMVLYGGYIETFASANAVTYGPLVLTPIALVTIGLAALIFIGPLVKQWVGRFLLVG